MFTSSYWCVSSPSSVEKAVNDVFFDKGVANIPCVKHDTSTEQKRSIEILIPGVKKSDIELELVEGQFKISVAGKTYYLNIDNVKSQYDLEGVEAKLDLGILTIDIPKVKKENKKITIK
jgi:HSP20 family molecular chaperone IbpA